MVNISEAFTTKVGPLPAIAWAGMAGGVFVIYKYATRSKEPAIATVGDTIPDYASGGVGNADDFSNGYGNATGSFGGSGGTATGTVPPIGILDNVAWGVQALNYLVSTGTSVSDATRAIHTYLYGTGEPLNSTQNAAWQRAVTHLGNPPEGILDSPTVTPDTPTVVPVVPPPTTGNVTTLPIPVATIAPTPSLDYRGRHTVMVTGDGARTVSQLAAAVPNKAAGWYTWDNLLMDRNKVLGVGRNAYILVN